MFWGERECLWSVTADTQQTGYSRFSPFSSSCAVYMDIFHKARQRRKFDGESRDVRYLWLIREQIQSRFPFIERET